MDVGIKVRGNDPNINSNVYCFHITVAALLMKSAEVSGSFLSPLSPYLCRYSGPDDGHQAQRNSSIRLSCGKAALGLKECAIPVSADHVTPNAPNRVPIRVYTGL